MNLYFMPNTSITLDEVKSSKDWHLIQALLELNLLVVLFCVMENEGSNRIEFHSAYKNTYSANQTLMNLGGEYDMWTEVISIQPLDHPDWNWSSEGEVND